MTSADRQRACLRRAGRRSAVLIRGPSGAGKSRLAFDLILAGRAGQVPPAVLVGDDRVHLRQSGGQLVVRPARELAGLIEIRGLGIFHCDFARGDVGLVVDLAPPTPNGCRRRKRSESTLTVLNYHEFPSGVVSRRFHWLSLP